MTDTPIIRRGTRVYCILSHAGRGVVTAVSPDPMAGDCYVVGTNAVCRELPPAEGWQRYDVVFESGAFSRGLPDSVIRGVQWRILEGAASEEEIASLIAAHERMAAEKAEEAERARIAFERERARLMADPDHRHLTQGDDAGSGNLAAKNIRAILRRSFPGVNFSVRKHDYGSVFIHWEDGPTDAEVGALVAPFESGYFDSSQDLFINTRSPWTAVFGGAKFISTTRAFSRHLIDRAIARAMAELGDIGIPNPTADEYQAGDLSRIETPDGRDLEAVIRRTAAEMLG